MSQRAPIEAVREAVESIQQEGVESFTAEDIRSRADSLGEHSTKAINEALTNLQQAGLHIHPVSLGMGAAGALWQFGYRPTKSIRRRPIRGR